MRTLGSLRDMSVNIQATQVENRKVTITVFSLNDIRVEFKRQRSNKAMRLDLKNSLERQLNATVSSIFSNPFAAIAR